MDIENFQPRICRTCGQQKSELRDGQEIILRCNCDWTRGFHEQLVKTVHPDFYKKRLITLTDWSPPIFKGGGSGKFKSLIKIQKAFAIKRLHDFCFKILSENEKTKEREYSIESSIEKGRNLYIRGPAGSGRGLLMSSIKIFAAARGLTTTPNPGEWSTFKADILEAESWSKTGDEAKLVVAERYKAVDILTLENVRGEGVSSFATERKFQPRFKASTQLDDFFTKRQARAGAMVFTSPDFVRQMADSMGDRFPEILQSDSTSLILMFSSLEADSLHAGITKKLASFQKSVLGLQKEIGKGTASKDHLDENRAIEAVKGALFFEHLYSNIPLGTVSDDSVSKVSVTDSFFGDPGSWKPSALAVWKQFKEDRDTGNLAYHEGVKKAFIDATSEAPELSNKMTDKERYEVGKMMHEACQPKEKLNAMIERALELRKKMVEQ